MLVCMPIENIQAATWEDAHMQELKAYIIQDWAHKKEDLAHSMIQYWPIRSELEMFDCIAMKGKRITIPFQLQKEILQQVHSSHMGIEKIRLLAHESVYWVNMNEDIENTVKEYATCLDYQQT